MLFNECFVYTRSFAAAGALCQKRCGVERKNTRLKLPLALALLGSLLPAFGQFGGPAILSRGQTPAPMAGSQITFRPFVAVLATVDTGLAGVSVTSEGALASETGEGITLSWGVSGSHVW